MREMCNKFVSAHTNDTAQEATSNKCCCATAQAYVSSQKYVSPMDNEQSLVCGTAFSNLVVPYCAGWHLYQLAKEV